MHIISRACLPLALALLAACGGGGGSTTEPPAGTPPTLPPATPPPAVTAVEAFRFLNQSTFGATTASAQELIALGDSSNAYGRWIDAQMAMPASLHLPTVLAAFDALPAGTAAGAAQADRMEIWFRHALSAPDQLRQRVAFALSEIMVVSQTGGLQDLPLATTDFYDILVRNAFGNYRELLKQVTLSPAMGIYLSMLGNEKPDTARNIRPDENYAREVMQLFSIGLVMLNADGSVPLDASGQPYPTYDQSVIEGFAHAFTGWKWAWTAAGTPNFATVRSNRANQMMPMQAYADRHATTEKKLLNGVMLPMGQTAARDLDDALDNLAGHANVAPFISRQLIQRLVTSNPSPAYVGRVAAKFNNDGAGARGNLGAVVRAILLDPEARDAPVNDTAGKMKEPLLRLTQVWRAYGARQANGRLTIQPGATFGQAALQSPSVFNFFSPGYAPAGEMADRNLVAPELQIATEYQNTSVTNYLYQQIFNRSTAVANQADTSIVIDVSAEQALIANSASMVNLMADKLLGGRISDTMRTQAIAMADSRPATDALRTSEALYLIATSPEFALQR